MSTPDRWQQVERLYHDALARDERARAAFLREACGSDEPLRREVESLLAYASGARGFMDAPAIVAAAAVPPDDAAAGRQAGQRLGPYEIGPLLGAGGMGEVYRARDTKLGRDVAIKFLPDIFVADAERRARFEREARLLASLNHPHIGAIYGLEEREGLHGLVLELVDGDTLAERLRRGRLPLQEALTIARQIADALEAAHERGIVHRDLKPANIAITRAGVVKVLDFGLAKAAAGQPGQDLAPTAEGATREGVILGTAPYMSPEQARGKDVDKRTDIWAFGCVVWEMLAGRKAFAGATSSDTIAAILERDPDWRLLPAGTPASLMRLLQRCLEKDPKRRLHDIADARIEIDDALTTRAAPNVDAGPARGRVAWRRFAIAGAILATLAAVAAALLIWIRRAPDITTPTRLSVFTPGQLSPQLSATISPDGRQLAFVTTGESGKLMLWVRALDSVDARVLPGTENAAHPFWSPDSRFLGFQAEGRIKTIEAAGGPVETLAESPLRAGASWGRDGRILFLPRSGGIATVPAGGGPVSVVLSREAAGGQPFWPHFLPDGRHFLFHRSGARPEQRGVYAGSLGSLETKQILQTDYKAAYASGHLLFVRSQTLMAQPFDTDRLTLTGQPLRVADGVWAHAGAAQASFSASQTGVVAYVNAARSNLGLAWFDRAGRPLGPISGPEPYSGSPELSPDGRRLAITKQVGSSVNVWLLDAAGETSSRITFGATREVQPVWSPDAVRIAFRSETRVLVKNANSTGADELLFESGNIGDLLDWSADGRFLVYTAKGSRSLSDLWLAPLFADLEPRPFLETAFNKAQAQVSPDSRWIAYTSYESGGDEVYVDSFPTPGNKRQVSISGGVQPRWRKDGKELFYIGADQRMMAVPVGTGATFEAGAPMTLFKTRLLPHGSQSIGLATLYDVSPDGQRFVSFVYAEGPPITVVLNWTAALK